MIKNKQYIAKAKTNKFKTHLFTQSLNHLFTFPQLLTNVTNIVQNRQLLAVTCFIIHVGSICIGEKAYA